MVLEIYLLIAAFTLGHSSRNIMDPLDVMYQSFLPLGILGCIVYAFIWPVYWIAYVLLEVLELMYP